MPAYCLFDIVEVIDSEKMADYRRRVRPAVERYGGRYLAVGDRFDVVEGNWRPAFPVIIEFSSLAEADWWYD